MLYEIVLSMDATDGGDSVWLVTVPAFPEVTTFGDTEEEAGQNALRAIEEAIGGRMSDGEDIPAPQATCPAGGRCVDLSALTF